MCWPNTTLVSFAPSSLCFVHFLCRLQEKNKIHQDFHRAVIAMRAKEEEEEPEAAAAGGSRASG